MNLSNMIILLILLSCLSVGSDALIGLRPPNKIPKPPKDPGENKTTGNQSEWVVTDSASCHVMPLMRCGFRLLRQSLRNETPPCNQVQTFTKCAKDGLRNGGRRDFVTGLTLLSRLTSRTDEIFSCGSNTSGLLPLHTRHQRTKRSYSKSGHVCCSDSIVNCSIQTFLKMSTNPGEKCNLVNYFYTCLSDAAITCQHKSLTQNTISMFTTQLHGFCRRQKRRFV